MLYELECPVEHSLFYDCLHCLLLFRLGGAVKEGEEEDHSIAYDGVCRADPDFARVC